ncbi:MAG: dTDP-4-dehydrorhamnose 3,5-epimerase [Deltaproteobacteria bacterium]|nr:dTDP-4-dehydrorhamnose 3,5-epimerase [Deltaproteobacteria bacterium]
MPFNFKRLSISDIILIEPKVFADERGAFSEAYKHSDFVCVGIAEYFIQDNYVKSVKGVLRGLHYQKNPKSQGKLVQCVRGEIFDVAVDIRKGSPTYGQWVGIELSSEEHNMLYVPKGFAHGYVVLSDFAEVIYKCTKEYSPQDERGIIWNDPDIKIEWHIKEPILSEKDKILPQLKFADNNFGVV